MLARENLLYTIIDNRRYKFGDEPTNKQLEEIASVISWNIWQMDGITCDTPFSEQIVVEQTNLFMAEGAGDVKKVPLKSQIYDWQQHKKIIFQDLLKGA